MKRFKPLQGVATAIVLLSLVSLAFAQETPKVDDAAKSIDPAKTLDPAVKPATVEDHSYPSATTKPAFGEAGKVKEILVKPGDVVKAGQLLGTEDSDMDQADLKLKQIAADSTVEVEYAVAERDAKKLVYENKQKAGDSVTAFELQTAKLEFDQAEIKIKAAQEKHDQAQADLAKQAIKIEKMKLFSPMDGIVQEIKVHPGEVADPAKPDGAMTLVQTNPLWLDVHLKSSQAAKLKVGQTLSVSYENEPEKWFGASIIYFDPVVNAMVDQQTVRLELKNDDGKPAGYKVIVRLPWPAEAGTDEADRTAISR